MDGSYSARKHMSELLGGINHPWSKRGIKQRWPMVFNVPKIPNRMNLSFLNQYYEKGSMERLQ